MFNIIQNKKYLQLSLFTKILVLILIIGCAAWILPYIILKINSNNFEGEKMVYGMYALQNARQFIGGSLEPLIVTGFKIIKIEEDQEQIDKTHDIIIENMEMETSRKDQRLIGKAHSIIKHDCYSITLGGDETPIKLSRPYKATVRIYSFFGIPYTDINIHCFGAYRS